MLDDSCEDKDYQLPKDKGLNSDSSDYEVEDPLEISKTLKQIERGKAGIKNQKASNINAESCVSDIDNALPIINKKPKSFPSISTMRPEMSRTPSKESSRITSNEKYYNASRALGCCTPEKENVNDQDTSFYINLSFKIHEFYDKNGLIFGDKPLSLSMMDKIIGSLQDDGLKLFKGSIDASDIYFEKVRNGIKNKSKYAGDINNGFLDHNGIHQPDLIHCPFQHCMKLKEHMSKSILNTPTRFVGNNLPNTPKTPLTPSTPISMRNMIKEMKGKNKDLKLQFELETERSTIFLQKLQKKEGASVGAPKRFECPLCDSTFTRIDTVQRHLRTIHKNIENPSLKKKDTMINCKFCSKPLASRSLDHHLLICKALPRAAPASPKVDKRSGFCSLCKEIKSNLAQHKKNAHPVLECRICEKAVALKRCNGCLQMICENCISPESIGVNHEGFCLQCTILPEQKPFQCSIMIKKRCLKCKSIKHQKQCISCEVVFCKQCSNNCICGCKNKIDWCQNCRSSPKNSSSVLVANSGGENQLEWSVTKTKIDCGSKLESSTESSSLSVKSVTTAKADETSAIQSVENNLFDSYQLSPEEKANLSELLKRIEQIENEIAMQEDTGEESEADFISKVLTNFANRNVMCKEDQTKQNRSLKLHIQNLIRDGFPYLKKK